jgi:hypothetical protein
MIRQPRQVLSIIGAAWLAALPLAACQERGEAGTRPPSDAASTDQIKESPAGFYGKSVQVSGTVDQLYDRRAFELEGTGWAFDDNITVLTQSPVELTSGPLVDDDEVIVTGTVRPFVTAEVERDLGWDLDRDLEIKLERRPVIVAQTIRTIGEQGRWTAGSAGGSDRQPVATVVTVFTAVDPAALAGQPVDMGRERVQAVMGKGLWVGPNHLAQVFVQPGQMPKDIQAGDMIRVRGTLQKVPENAAKQWGMPASMRVVVGQEGLFVDDATVEEVQAPQADDGAGAQTGQDAGATPSR